MTFSLSVTLLSGLAVISEGLGMSSASVFSSAIFSISDFSGASASTGVVASSLSDAAAVWGVASCLARSSSLADSGAFLEAGAGWSSFEGEVTLWRTSLTTGGGEAKECPIEGTSAGPPDILYGTVGPVELAPVESHQQNLRLRDRNRYSLKV